MKRWAGFTLIELLVVIAIIGLLLAILIPSLTKVKEKARDVICRTHLRGVGMAIKLYLDENNQRAYNCSSANNHVWYDPANPSEYIDIRTSGLQYYWGLAYIDYAEDPKVFGCPSFARVFDMLYEHSPTVTKALAPYAGYGLNGCFFRDAKMVAAGVTSTWINNRKLSDIKSPSSFIVTQDHVEPKFEGNWVFGSQPNDQMSIPSGQTYNLEHYRPPSGGRREFYWGIFRHNKKSPGLDNEAEHLARLSTMDDSPNGTNNALTLDGHVESIRETTGKNFPERRYTGI